MEGDAGARQLNPTDADDTSLAESVESVVSAEADASEPTGPGTEPSEPAEAARRPSRLGRTWGVAICAGLCVLAVAAVVIGLQLRKAHGQTVEAQRAEAAALQAAKDCVAATHAPDVAAMVAAQTKIIECSTGDFGAQASLYAGVLVDAYQAANATVQVSDMRAAVERHHDDGAFDVLVAVQVRVTNSEAADRDLGYRLRVRMEPEDGTYKIARLDQVTS